MLRAVETAEAEVHAAFCNNIATKDALDALSRLVSQTQKYKDLRFKAPPGELLFTMNWVHFCVSECVSRWGGVPCTGGETRHHLIVKWLAHINAGS